MTGRWAQARTWGGARGTAARWHLLAAVIVFGSWEAYRRLGDPLLLPPVSAVLAGLVEITAAGALPAALLESVQLLALGFGISLAAGTVLGILIGRYELAHRVFGPFLNALYATPDIALLPLVLLWFGFGMPGRVVVVFLAAFFPIMINTYAGVRDAPRDLLEVAASFGVRSELGKLRKVILPAALPLIMAGYRLGIGRAVVGMAVAEVYLRLSGIGALIVQYGAALRTDLLLAAILPLPLLGIALTKVFERIENRFQYWRHS
ncbi:ABC transporter permease [Pseudonocardia kunmingensis]|uniref:NitT/TauT family transport system permease protein n=1 Tax=Pseudonocardia kunmingensis TaxID=630975 RepID=A0A543DQ53_9PSEU|nr:ABC transporter permease [Pseudonocardia kunmingensis]TQM11467.1 NitT/TauT family transport system permease protein [Pseudonocardia kunmingensis]